MVPGYSLIRLTSLSITSHGWWPTSASYVPTRVYQGELALLLAEDPAADLIGDRLVGYTLLAHQGRRSGSGQGVS